MTLTSDLATLESDGLIRLISLYPEVEYLFRHALIQEAGYQSLVRSQRRRLHQIVGESLERLYPAQLTSAELAAVLAQHFAEAGDTVRAQRYYTLVGRAAADMYANAEAIHHFSLALALARARPGERAAAADLFLRLGHALELNAQDAQAIQNYEAMQAWAEAGADRPAQLAALAARATIYVKPSVEQNLPAGYDLSQQALALARALGDRAAEAKVLWNLLQYHAAVLHMETAVEVGEQALALARQEGLREQTAYVLTDLLKVYFQMEQTARAMAALEEARAIWRELGVQNMLADNLASTATLLVISGDYSQAVSASQEAMRVSRLIGNLWDQSYALFMLDLAHFDRGEVGLALETAEACRRLAEEAGFANGLYQTQIDLVLIYAYMGAPARAFEVAAWAQAPAYGPGMAYGLEAVHIYLLALAGRVAEARVELTASSIPQAVVELQRVYVWIRSVVVQTLAELALAEAQPQRALALADDFLPVFTGNGVALFYADALELKGRALRSLGRAVEAQTALEQARAAAEAVGSRRMLWLILAGLAELADERGDRAGAVALRRQAAEQIAYIADHAGAPDLRESFLSRPDVRKVLGKT